MATPGVPVYDASTWKKRSHRRVVVDGRSVLVKLPPQKFIVMINGVGTEVNLPLHTGPAQKADHDPYALAVLSAKQKMGTGKSTTRDGLPAPAWIIKGVCPQTGNYDVHQSLPDSVRGKKPCTAGAKGGPISNTDPCTCVLETVRARTAIHNEAMAALELSYKTDGARAAEQSAQAMAGVGDLVAEMRAERTGAEKGKK